MGGSQSTPAPAEPLAINNNAPKRNTGEADTVIIPVDGSKQSEAAFLWYLNHVHRKDNILHIRHCQELNQGAPLRSEHSYGFQSQTWSEIVEERKVEGMKIVEKYEGKLAEHNLKGTVEFSLADRPGEYLIDQTEHLKGSMIVMGTRGYINHCHKESNVVRVLHCQELHHSAPLSGEQFKADSWVDQMNQTRADSLKVVNRYEQRLKERNIKGSVQFEVGKPGEVVIQYADRFRGTHIVIGTRGFGLLRRTILGSVSEYVIHHSKIPVTIVPPETQSWFF
ncbi:hypothetical protein CAPTEDRAFT_220518 [Capitella teleta]|uniref:UspA domain-containing protein n=1 Tax=Capitella teleta TaxID=283909 RepID=R7TN79_CAPTE|nr:hypothetical protein CAPTEDRAFT_220518 [Capitella teleta]|eukprot:ELT93011.1 hypothetical protein CAPTEDRAFT_220518 [Capitella teleta]